jgi:hypothetical protein
LVAAGFWDKITGKAVDSRPSFFSRLFSFGKKAPAQKTTNVQDRMQDAGLKTAKKNVRRKGTMTGQELLDLLANCEIVSKEKICCTPLESEEETDGSGSNLATATAPARALKTMPPINPRVKVPVATSNRPRVGPVGFAVKDPKLGSDAFLSKQNVLSILKNCEFEDKDLCCSVPKLDRNMAGINLLVEDVSEEGAEVVEDLNERRCDSLVEDAPRNEAEYEIKLYSMSFKPMEFVNVKLKEINDDNIKLEVEYAKQLSTGMWTSSKTITMPKEVGAEKVMNCLLTLKVVEVGNDYVDLDVSYAKTGKSPMYMMPLHKKARLNGGDIELNEVKLRSGYADAECLGFSIFDQIDEFWANYDGSLNNLGLQDCMWPMYTGDFPKNRMISTTTVSGSTGTSYLCKGPGSLLTFMHNNLISGKKGMKGYDKNFLADAGPLRVRFEQNEKESFVLRGIAVIHYRKDRFGGVGNQYYYLLKYNRGRFKEGLKGFTSEKVSIVDSENRYETKTPSLCKVSRFWKNNVYRESELSLHTLKIRPA